jgi:hypothetical protein
VTEALFNEALTGYSGDSAGGTILLETCRYFYSVGRCLLVLSTTDGINDLFVDIGTDVTPDYAVCQLLMLKHLVTLVNIREMGFTIEKATVTARHVR